MNIDFLRGAKRGCARSLSRNVKVRWWGGGYCFAHTISIGIKKCINKDKIH